MSIETIMGLIGMSALLFFISVSVVLRFYWNTTSSMETDSDKRSHQRRLFFSLGMLILLVCMTTFIPLISEGVAAARYIGCVAVLFQISANVIALLDSGITSIRTFSASASRFWSQDRLTISIAIAAKISNFLVVGIFLFSTFTLQEITNVDGDRVIGFAADASSKDILFKYPEHRIVALTLSSGAIGFFIAYYAFYVRIVTSMRASDANALRTYMKNTQQQSLLRMKENDIKNMTNSWHLKEEDVEFVKKIGAGAFGVVWRGVLHGKWEVAIKTIRMQNDGKSNVLSSGSLRGMTKEVEFLMRTRHSRLVMFLGFGTLASSGELFVVLEYMNGGELSTQIWQPAIVPTWEQRILWLEDVAEGLIFLHRDSKVHRDVKSPNILLTAKRPDDGISRAKLTDFGLAKFVRSGKRRYRSPATSSDSSASGMFEKNVLWTHANMTSYVGTPAWEAPELIGGDASAQYGPSVDVYAFGCVMIECLTLNSPWPGTKRQEIFENVRKGVKPPVKRVRDMPARYWELMMSCLSYEGKDRPPMNIVYSKLKNDIFVGAKTQHLPLNPATLNTDSASKATVETAAAAFGGAFSIEPSSSV